MKINPILVYRTLYCFTELQLVLFTINTRIVIKKVSLNMIMSIKQQFN